MLRVLFGLLCSALPATVSSETQGDANLELTLRADDSAIESLDPPNAELTLFEISVTTNGDVSHSGRLKGESGWAKHISLARRQRLLSLLKKERFFELKRGYGCGPDMPFRLIRASANGKRHEVSLCRVGEREGPSTRDAQRLLRIWWGCLRVLSQRQTVEIWERDQRILAQKP